MKDLHKEKRYERRSGDINKAFSLSYASFLVIPRTFLMDMPTEWQTKFSKLMEEYNDSIDDLAPDNEFSINVQFKKEGKFCKIPEVYTNYRHPKHLDVCNISCFRKGKR